MTEVEGPASVLVSALKHGFDRLADAAVGFDSCISQIVESAQHVVVPKGREREPEPAFVDDFAGSKRAEHAAFEQIVFGPLPGLGDGLRDGLHNGHGFVLCSLVFEQSFKHADGGMERRAPAFGCFAVPAAIFELLAQELIGQCIVRFFEIRADGQDSPVDAGLRFTVKERPVVKRLKDEPLVDPVDHFAGLLAGGVETEVHQHGKSVEGNQQASVLLPHIVSRPAWAAAPVADRRLAGEKLSSPAFGCDARLFGCDRIGGFICQVPHDLPTDSRVRIEEPFEVRWPGRVIVWAHS